MIGSRTVTKMAKVLGVLLLGALLLLGVLEVLARVLHWWPDVFYQPDERFGYAHIPNAEGWWVNIDSPSEFQTYIRVNSKGLRDREYSYEKPRGVFRILVLGDSFADAMEVPLEHSFQEVLEAQLNAQLEMPVEVINGGHWGYGNDLELLFYRLEGYKYEPDLVLLAFQSTSDVLENHREMETRHMGKIYKPFFVLEDDQLTLTNWPFPVETAEQPPPEGILERIKAWLASHSRLYPVAGRFIKQRLRSLAAVMRTVGVMDPEEGDVKTDNIPTAMYIYAVDYPPEWEEAWAVTLAILRQLDDEVAENGAEFAALLLPDRHQVEGDYLAWALQKYPAMQGSAWDLDKPNRIMREFLTQEAIPFLEMTEEFRARAEEANLRFYYPRDGHWNVEGHRLAGELLADKLCQQELVPCKE